MYIYVYINVMFMLFCFFQYIHSAGIIHRVSYILLLMSVC